MQRLFSLKIINKIPRNELPKPTALSLQANPFHRYLFSGTHPQTHIHHQQQQHSGYSPHLSWLMRSASQSPTNRLMKYPNQFRSFSNPLLSGKVLQNRLLKGSCKTLFPNGARRCFQQNLSLDSRHRMQRNQRRLATELLLLGLIATNVAVFFLWKFADPKFMAENFALQLDTFKFKNAYTVITSAFSHTGNLVLFTNMSRLYIYGMWVGLDFGPKVLLKVYLAGAFVGSAFHLGDQAFFGISPERMQKSFPPGADAAAWSVTLLHFLLFGLRSSLRLSPVVLRSLVPLYVSSELLSYIKGDWDRKTSAQLGAMPVALIAWGLLRKRRL